MNEKVSQHYIHLASQKLNAIIHALMKCRSYLLKNYASNNDMGFTLFISSAEFIAKFMSWYKGLTLKNKEIEST